MAEIAEIPNAGTDKLEAPYAPPSAVIDLLHRYRERTPPQQFTTAILEDIGISKGNTHRVLAALEFLGFLDAKNRPQPALLKLRTLSEDEYRELLAERIRGAYHRLFETMDPENDPPDRLRDHFRRYDPASQTNRQYLFFGGLCVEAGIIQKHRPTAEPTPKGARKSPPRTADQPRARVPQEGPLTEEAVRLRTAEVLIEKLKEANADDQEKIEWYLEQIEKLRRKEDAARK
jgi:hypothetical protein